MFRLFAGGFALAVLALAAHPVGAADEKKDAKDKATVWTREANGVDLKFEIGKDTAKYHVFHGDDGCIVTSKIKVEKDLVTSEVTDVEVKGNFPGAPKKGDKLSFKWVVKGDTATLSDLTGDNTEGAKDVVEGEYKKKK
jgi:hypothetical protein